MIRTTMPSSGKHLLLLFAACLFASCTKTAGPPYAPSESLKTIKIADGYKIELFASEPDVVSPVAMEFDENGDIYVVEDRGYPVNIKGKVGRIKLLRDINGDGVPDEAKIFADHLVMPTGVMRWKKGILVTDAPDVLYLEDTDGDGKADIRRKVLTGFPFTNPQHTVNSPVYGLDNWIYLAHEPPATATIFKEEFGDRGSDIRFVDRQGSEALKAPGRNIRFRPDTGQLEVLSSPSQFGHSFDDWGRHFLVSNSNHVRQEAIAARYLRRNPDLPIGSAVEDISDHMPTAKVFPITQNPRFELLSGVGEFTSACGIAYYRGSTFVAEPVHNLIHQDLLVDGQSLYTAKRAQNQSEFLASTDAWFRPVNLTVGPDGALYVVDYYRMIVEHPEWMSSEHHHSHDSSQKAEEYGRIYRIVPIDGTGALKKIRLGDASNEELVPYLTHPVIWWRRTAQRLLIDRKAVQVVPSIEKLLSGTASSQGRVHALWTLEGLGKLNPSWIAEALTDPEAGVRENAIILAEQHLLTAPDLEKNLLNLEDDTSARVRYQLTLTLGNLKTPASRETRDRLLFANIEDKWLQLAALSADSDDAPRLFAKAVQAGKSQSNGRAMLFRYVSSVIGARQQPTEMDFLLEQISQHRRKESAWWKTNSLEGFNQGLRSKHGSVSTKSQRLLVTLFEQEHSLVRRAALHVLQTTGLPATPSIAAATKRAAKIASDKTADSDYRADAVSFLALSGLHERKDFLRSLIDAREPEAVQAAAIRAYGQLQGADIDSFLIEKWRAFTPSVRGEAADALLLEPAREKKLAEAIQNGSIQPWTLAFRHKIRLVMNPDPAVRNAVRPLLEQTPQDRALVVKQYEPVLNRTANAARGEQVFRDICAKCHRLNGYGAEVGPDLGTVRNQPKQILLTNILIPSQSIAQGYESYVVETANGGQYDGVIGPQTPTAITLRHEDGKEDVIQRHEIKTMYVTNLSAMPADLEKQISMEQMADLLEYLKTAK